MSLIISYLHSKPAMSVNRKFWLFVNQNATSYDREVIFKKVSELRTPIAACETFTTSELHHQYQVDGISLERFGYIGSNVAKNGEDDSLRIGLRFCTDELTSTIIERELAPLGFTKEQE